MLTTTYIRIQATTVQGLTREETLQGRNYLVMPVVALVEGVLQGANSEGPEFAAAAEFGKNIQGWNGRPVVMDHPKDDNGNYVSANSSAIMNAWAFGWIFNAQIEDKKLKAEAWLDTARAEDLGGDFLETLNRIKDGEMVEVSVGVFINPVSKKGKYKGKTYSSVWTNVVPDHLAFLSNGTIGACSNEDGCGAPRLNRSMMADGDGAELNPGATDSTHDSNTEVQTLAEQLSPTPELSPQCSCHDETEASGPSEDHLAARAAYLATNSLPADRFNSDIYKAISVAISKKYKGYCYGYTTEFAVYDTYDIDSYMYVCYKVGINVDSNLVVTFTSEPSEVKVVMQIIDSTQTEDTMSTNNTTQAGSDAPANLNPNPAPAPAPAPAATPVTLADYIAAAPSEIQDVLSESMRVHAERKSSTIKILKDTKRCPYSEDELKAMSIDQLNKLVQLAGIPAPQAPTHVLADYSGLGAPRVELGDENQSPEPLRVWN